MRKIYMIVLVSSAVGLQGYIERHVQLILDLSKKRGSIQASRVNLQGAGDLLKRIQVPGINLSQATLNPCVPTDYLAYSLYEVCIQNQITNLSGANLSDANLFGANFNFVNLTGANLSNADASYASFMHAVLTDADISGMKTKGTNFYMAYMPDGTLCGDGATWTGQGQTISCGQGPNS